MKGRIKILILSLVTIVSIFLLASSALAATYRVDLTYTTPIYVDEWKEKGEFYEFRTGSMIFPVKKEFVKAIIPVSATEKPGYSTGYVTREEYEKQLREAQEEQRRLEYEQARQTYVTEVRSYQPVVVYPYPYYYPVYYRPYYYPYWGYGWGYGWRHGWYPRGGVSVWSGNGGFWFGFNIPIYFRGHIRH